MTDRPATSSFGSPAHIALRAQSAQVPLTGLSIGTDNIHHDVFLSPRFTELAQRTIRDMVSQAGNIGQYFSMALRTSKAPEVAVFKKQLSDLLQASLARAQFEKNIDIDLLLRIALLRFLTHEVAAQFSDVLLQCKQWIGARGDFFERSEQAHVLRSRLADLQAERRNVFRQVGQQLYQILAELDETLLSKSRKALFGDEYAAYALLKNRLVFVEGGRDDQLLLDHYVLLGNFIRDVDRFETFEAMLLDLLREFVLADPQGEEMSAAWEEFNALTERALAARADLAGLEEDRDARVAKLERGDDLLSS